MSEEEFGSVPVMKDLEGVDETFKSIPKPKGDRQKKIAVLTSGGDSAGMNAAGEFELNLLVLRGKVLDGT